MLTPRIEAGVEASPRDGNRLSREVAPMAHVAMWREIDGSADLVRQITREIRASGWDGRWGARLEDLERAGSFHPAIEEQTKMHFRLWGDRRAAVGTGNLWARHLHYMVSFELHHRKTFWVDESLAWMLARTRVDISGSCLRLPFPCCAFVFTDPETLELCSSLLADESCRRLHHRRLDILTVYVSTFPVSSEPDAVGLHTYFMVDAGQEDWPYLLARDLVVRPDDDLEEILDSRHPDIDVQEVDPLFLAPELERLEHLVLNAILYTTSAHLEPLRFGASLARGEDRDSRRRAEEVRRGTRNDSGQGVYYLPGKIPIARLRQMRELETRQEGRRIMKRFMVRGHWRRASEHWKDQRLRWIEPHWKGPEIAPILEREYRLRP